MPPVFSIDILPPSLRGFNSKVKVRANGLQLDFIRAPMVE
jgi:hypothetical protein